MESIRMRDSSLRKRERALDPSNRLHRVTRIWTVAVIRCVECEESWEQPMYADDGTTWVCPHCLHGARAPWRTGR
jgi:hypothetical protein